MAISVTINEPQHHPDYHNLSQEELTNWWTPGHEHQIRAVLLSEQRQVWIGQECFPAKELWTDDNGNMLIESPAGNVYAVESVNTWEA